MTTSSNMGAVAAGQFAHLRDAGLAPLSYNVGSPVPHAEVRAGLVPAHQYDLVGTELFCGQNGHQPNGAVGGR
jgi:hypothetical protein